MNFTPEQQAEMWAGTIADAMNDRQERLERGGGDDREFNLAYLSDGIFSMRFFPELYQAADGKQRYRIMRKYYQHYLRQIELDGKKRNIRVICEGESCRVCKEVARLHEVKYRDAYRFSSDQQGLVKSMIFTGPTDEFVKIGEQHVLVLNYRQIAAFDDFLADIDPPTLARLMDPSTEQNGIKINSWFEKERRNATVSLDVKYWNLPPIDPKMPVDLTPIYVKDTDRITDEQLAAFQKHVSQIIAGKLTNQDPTPQSPQNTAALFGGAETGQQPPGATSTASAQQQQPTVQTPTPQSNTVGSTVVNQGGQPVVQQVQQSQASNDEKCVGVRKGEKEYGMTEGLAHFGAPPVKMIPTCLICGNRAACHAAKVAA